VPPAIAVLGPIMREREDVVGGLANGAQDSAALGREGWVSFLERYTGGNNDVLKARAGFTQCESRGAPAPPSLSRAAASRAADIKTIFQR
jgi:hypothetical protein